MWNRKPTSSQLRFAVQNINICARKNGIAYLPIYSLVFCLGWCEYWFLLNEFWICGGFACFWLKNFSFVICKANKIGKKQIVTSTQLKLTQFFAFYNKTNKLFIFLFVCLDDVIKNYSTTPDYDWINDSRICSNRQQQQKIIKNWNCWISKKNEKKKLHLPRNIVDKEMH